MSVELKRNATEQERFIKGMERYQKQGVKILIGGVPADESTWGKLFEPRDDGGFYMGDYIFEEGTKTPETPVSTNWNGVAVVREAVSYGTGRRLKEIHFDLIYNR